MPDELALIVDDSPTSRDIFTTILEHDGFRVRSVGSGKEALEAIAEETPDVVLLDLFLPHVDGFEVLKQVRSNPGTRHVPVVCITAGATEQTRERAEGLGCDAIAFKPEGPQEVLQLVREVLQRRTGEDGGSE